jgi:hypothetical protein
MYTGRRCAQGEAAALRLQGEASAARTQGGRKTKSTVVVLLPSEPQATPPEAKPAPPHLAAPSTRQALMPPKPKEFLSR